MNRKNELSDMAVAVLVSIGFFLGLAAGYIIWGC